jgi:hypothetical protein
MAYNTSNIEAKAKKFQTQNSMAVAASSVSADANEEEVRKSVAEIVSSMLDELPGIITWFISENWAGKLVARIVDAVGQTILEWLQ